MKGTEKDMNRFLEFLQNPNIILADGAMGTLLFQAGLEHGAPPELWNVEQPEKVRAVQRAYLQAGSQIILTNTFGGTRFRLAMHGLESRVKELNRAGAAIARAEVDAAGGRAIVAGDIGPSGEILAPLGALEYADAVAGFAEQAEGLIAGGVDVIWIETMSDLEEVRAAMEGVRRVSRDVPIIATMTFDTHGRTMMGVTPEQAVKAITEWGAVATGGNCGNGPDELLTVIEKMRAAKPDAVLVSKSNAGKPQLVEGKVVYPAGPDEMAHYAVEMRNAGARVIGACCGSSPAHLRAISRAVKDHAFAGESV
jgi:5-methyltetrahydrofolate--homocysteine methyltransferase